MLTPNGDSPFFGAIRYGDFTHALAFTKKSIAQVLAITSFIDIQVYPTGPVICGFLSAGRWILWKI
jgi:hypothetical protein